MKLLILSIFFLTSCSSLLKKKEDETSVKAIEQVKGKAYMRHKVSVKTVLMQTHAAYLRGCLDQVRGEKANSYPYCRELADTYVDEFVISILDQ